MKDNLITLIVVSIAMFMNWCVVSLLWLWFVVPVFGAPVLSIAQVGGISLMATSFTKAGSYSKYADPNLHARTVATKAVEFNIFALILGVILKAVS